MHIEQRTAEWHQQRVGKVTGSRVGGILGLSPFTKSKDIMRAMVREYHGAESEFVGNVATSYGTANEKAAIMDFELEAGMSVQETGFHVHDQLDWLGASPDGFVGENSVIEVKCPYGKRDSAEFESIVMQPHYFAQVQIEMYVTGRLSCYFFQWSQHGTRLEVVDFDPEWIATNIPKLFAFYESYLKELKDPERHLAELVKDVDAQDAANEYESAKAAFEAAEERFKAAKQAMIDIADGKKCCVSGYLVYKTSRAGSVSYAKVVKDHCPGVDLTPYTGKPVEYWTVK